MKLKRILSFILSICMLATLFVVPTFADGDHVLSFTVDASKVGVGDTVTVVISNEAMSIDGLAVYLEFNKDLLECISVTGVDGDEYMGLYKTNGGKFPFDEFLACDSLAHPEFGDMINNDGMFSIGHAVSSTTAYDAGIVATLQFRAKANGNIEFKLYDANVDQLIQSDSVEVHTCSFAEVVAPDDSNLVSAADCDNAAVYNKVCTCGATNGETFEVGAALGHDHQAQLVSDADCDSAAMYKGVCSRCGDETDPYEVGASLGHDYKAQPVSGADCESSTMYIDVCSRCGDETEPYEVGEALGHDHQPQLVSEADCENAAMYKDVCSRCGDETAPYAVGEALGHDHQPQLVSEADCANAAMYKDVCSRCGDETAPYAVGEALGHDHQPQLVSEADCENAAMYKDVCSRCGDEKDPYAVGEALGHDHQPQLVSEADCENAAMYKDVCSRCGDEKDPYAVGEALGHNFSEEYNTSGEETHWFDCSNGCGTKDSEAPHEDADDDKICDVCEKELHKHSYSIPKFDADGHWNECDCGEIDPATGVIPHNYNILKYDSLNHWKACACGATTPAEAHTESDWVYDVVPTMSTPGHRYKTCTGCGIVLISERFEADIEWKGETYVITSSSSNGGNISPAGKSYATWGSEITYYFHPDLGYEVDYVMVDGSYVGKVGSYTFTSIDASHSIYVVFKEIAPAYDDGYVAPPTIVIPEPSAPSEPAETDSKTYIAAVAKLAELKAVSTAECTEASAAAFNAAVLALEIAVESHASDDVLIECVANAYLAKANLSIAKNPVTCDD